MWHNSNNRGWACPPSPPPQNLLLPLKQSQKHQTTSGGKTVLRNP